MKLRIIDSEKREAFEASWKRSNHRHPQGDIAKFNACFFANQFISECGGELGVERCLLDFDQCPGCGHHKTCAVRGLRISIINAIDFSAKRFRKQFEKGGKKNE